RLDSLLLPYTTLFRSLLCFGKSGQRSEGLPVQMLLTHRDRISIKRFYHFFNHRIGRILRHRVPPLYLADFTLTLRELCETPNSFGSESRDVIRQLLNFFPLMYLMLVKHLSYTDFFCLSLPFCIAYRAS